MISVIPPGAFRLLLAVAVVISHLSSFNIGRVAVILFFALSGYWVKDLWEKNPDIFNFWINRILRIWPVYIICTILASILLSKNMDIFNFIILGVASSQNGMILGVEWSLDIEIQFYIALPLILMMQSKIKRELSFALLLSATIIGWIIFYNFNIRNFMMYIPAFYIGIYIHNNKDTKISPYISLFSFMMIAVLAYSLPETRSLIIKGDRERIIDEDIFAMIWAIPLIPWLSHSLKIMSSSFDRHIGNISYPLYLIHEPIILYISQNHSLDFKTKILSIIIVSIVTMLFYIFIDVPIEKRRKNIMKRWLNSSRKYQKI